jgi:hypothetical protein
MKLPTIFTAGLAIILSQTAIASPVNNFNSTHDINSTYPEFSLEKREHDMSVRDCVLKGKPWGFVCCAHAWGIFGMHCRFISDPDLTLPEVGKCEPNPNRFNHGPFCAREITNKDGSEQKGGILPNQNFETKTLSQSEKDWGRYSPEGKRVLEIAMNGGLEYEPTDLTGTNHNRGNLVPDLHSYRPKNMPPKDIHYWTDSKVDKLLEGKTDLEKTCYHLCRLESEIQNGQLRCINYCWGYANDAAAYSKGGLLYNWSSWERACFFNCHETFSGDNEGELACTRRCRDPGNREILKFRKQSKWGDV